MFKDPERADTGRVVDFRLENPRRDFSAFAIAFAGLMRLHLRSHSTTDGSESPGDRLRLSTALIRDQPWMDRLLSCPQRVVAKRP